MNETLKQLKENNVAVIEIKNKALLNMIQAKRKGELCHCEETDSFFICNGETWVPYEGLKASNGINYSIYELNQSLINSMEPMTVDEIKNIRWTVNEWRDAYYRDEEYFMLLCKDINYYTIFRTTSIFTFRTLGEGVEDCLLADGIGQLYSVEATEDNQAIEIWTKPDNFDLPIVMYLFPYSQGVVTVGGH